MHLDSGDMGAVHIFSAGNRCGGKVEDVCAWETQSGSTGGAYKRWHGNKWAIDVRIGPGILLVQNVDEGIGERGNCRRWRNGSRFQRIQQRIGQGANQDAIYVVG